MMPDSQQLLQKLLSRARRLPKWTWGLAVLACIVLVAMLINPAGEAPPAAAQGSALFSDPTVSSAGLAVEVFLKFSLVLVVIYLGFYLLRRWQGKRPGGPTRQVSVLETVYLNPRRSVHLIKAGSRTILIGATDQQISLLAELEGDEIAPLETGLAQDQPADFASLLRSQAKAQ